MTNSLGGAFVPENGLCHWAHLGHKALWRLGECSRLRESSGLVSLCALHFPGAPGRAAQALGSGREWQQPPSLIHPFSPSSGSNMSLMDSSGWELVTDD